MRSYEVQHTLQKRKPMFKSVIIIIMSFQSPLKMLHFVALLAFLIVPMESGSNTTIDNITLVVYNLFVI